VNHLDPRPPEKKGALAADEAHPQSEQTVVIPPFNPREDGAPSV